MQLEVNPGGALGRFRDYPLLCCLVSLAGAIVAGFRGRVVPRGRMSGSAGARS